MLLRELTRALVRPFGYTTVRTPSGFRVVRRRGRDLVYLHDYEGGYDEYRAAQVYHNNPVFQVGQGQVPACRHPGTGPEEQ